MFKHLVKLFSNNKTIPNYFKVPSGYYYRERVIITNNRIEEKFAQYNKNIKLKLDSSNKKLDSKV